MKTCFDASSLSDDEKKRIDEFICLSSLRLQGTSCDPQQVAFCFLAARKFSLAQAVELYNNYQNLLLRENLPERIDPFDEDVRQELLSGKFVILNDHEPIGARVAQFFVRMCRSTTNQRALLQSILFQLDATFKREGAMRSGLVLIYDMTDAKFVNIDCSFGIKLFKLLQSSYPVRLRRILILTAPLWFRASFRVMHRFIRDQLPNCVNVLRPSPGTKLDALSHPDFVALRREHYAWLQTALTRTGWLLTDTEQSSKSHSQRVQTAAAFFGHPPISNSSGSVSDLSDPDSREDGDSLCSSPMDEDEVLSVGDLDPFALSSSYSSETDTADGDAPSDDVITSSHFHEVQHIQCKSNALSDPQHSRAPVPESREIHSLPVRGEHAETPTPPSVVRRLARPSNTSVNTSSPNAPTVATVVTRPSAINSSLLDTDMGFSENVLSPLAVEPITPTADSVDDASGGIKPAHFQQASGKIDQYRHSAGAESSCSSITSFFSTGSAGVSSALSTRSADCSPTGDHLFHRVALAARGGSLVGRLKADHPPLTCLPPDRGTWPDDGLHFPRFAPLAEDEVGDQTIRSDKRSSDCDCNGNEEDSDDSMKPSLNPPFANPPSWIIGVSHGRTIHQGPDECKITTGALENTLSTCDLNSDPVSDVTEDFAPDALTSQVSFIGADEQQTTNGDEIIAEEIPSSDEDVREMSDNEEDGQDINLDNYWMTPQELVEHVGQLGLVGLQLEYNAIVRIKSAGSRAAFKHSQNRQKNRYCDVICYDSSRVRLRSVTSRLSPSKCSESQCPSSAASKTSSLHRTFSVPSTTVDLVQNYIHANWVDGYRQKNAFICAQGPLFTTVGDFWQMIWDYHVPIVAMIAKVYEADSVKCFPYWPPPKRKLYFARGFAGTLPPEDTSVSGCSNPDDPSAPDPEFEVRNLSHQDEEYFTCSTLRLTHLKTGHRRTLKHFSFSSWPDHGVPRTTEGLLKLLSSVQQSYLDAIRPLGYTTFMDQKFPPPPIVVHCSAGIGRTGTYVTADICTKWLADPDRPDHRINIPLTVSRIRSQRYGCVQVAAQYVFCYRVVIDFAVQSGLLDAESVQWISSQIAASSEPLVGNSHTFDDEGTAMSTSSETDKFGRMSAAFAELRELFPPSQLLSIWHALHPRRDQLSGRDHSLGDSNFVLIENGCSDSDDSDESESDMCAHNDPETECA